MSNGSGSYRCARAETELFCRLFQQAIADWFSRWLYINTDGFRVGDQVLHVDRLQEWLVPTS